jgi:drug/metabolite transporter (DMT)-like permease
MLTEERRAYLELHVAVLLFGLTAILGDLIQLTALVLVWWRVFITSGSLAPFVQPRALWSDLGARQFVRLAGIGILVGLHWVAFYGAVKLSNASITLVCMATTSFFAALIEPLLIRRPVLWYELALGLLIIPGMWLVVGSVEASMWLGIVVGLSSALLAALFATLNKKYLGKTDPKRVTFIELGSAWVFLSLVLLGLWVSGLEIGAFFPPSTWDWFYILVLALLCTNLAYTLSLRALRHISAFASTLTINLEPVYGIVLAWLILQENEELSPNFYWGCVIILAAVLAYPILKKRIRAQG